MPISGITNKSQNIFWLDGYFFNATIHSPNNISITMLPSLVFSAFCMHLLLFGSFYSLWLVEIQSHPEQISLQIEKQHYFWFFVHSEHHYIHARLKYSVNKPYQRERETKKPFATMFPTLSQWQIEKISVQITYIVIVFSIFVSLKQAKFEQNKNFIFYIFLVPKILPVCDGREEAEKKTESREKESSSMMQIIYFDMNFRNSTTETTFNLSDLYGTWRAVEHGPAMNTTNNNNNYYTPNRKKESNYLLFFVSHL